MKTSETFNSLMSKGGEGEGVNQNETFSSYSPMMNSSFDVNWMTPSLIIYAHLSLLFSLSGVFV